MAHQYYIYLGRERGKRVIHKVGKTTQGCWNRCKNSDYLIGLGIEILLPGETRTARNKQLSEIETKMIQCFTEKFTVEHGCEYFRTTNHKWNTVKEIFLAEIEEILNLKGWEYIIHDGWVGVDNIY